MPDLVKKEIYSFSLKQEIKHIRKKQSVLISELKNQNTITLIFLAIHDSIWKYEEVYRLFKEDKRFEVSVVVIPLVRNGIADMETYDQSMQFFKANNYKTFSSYDYENKQWLDVNDILKPDIVFFTNPHNLTFDKYYIIAFKDRLTCYVPYAFVVIQSIHMHYNQKIHYFLWKHFVETNIHSDFALSYTKNNNENVIISGYPSLDVIFNSKYKPKEIWKTHTNNTYKIIWAPHHTISGQGAGLDYSSFMDYANYFMDLLNLRNDIQIAFKPHPLLKEKLYADRNWGKEKTDSYYNSWSKQPNGQLEGGDYIDLFYTSDAMIMDSASFIAEYLYFDKPLCFTKNDEDVKNRFNSFGQMIFDYLYTAKDKDEVKSFINDIVIGRDDYLKEKRNGFFENEILPKNGKTASENIYNELIDELC